MRTLGLGNNKGGVGKTTLAVHLATGLARQGKRVLLVDMDTQGHASRWTLGLLPADALGVADALRLGAPPPGALHQVPGTPGLAVLPATVQLPQAVDGVARVAGRDMVLRRVLEGLRRQYDYAILDTPPDVGLSTLNALCASDAVLVPVAPAFLALAGLARIDDAIQALRHNLRLRTYVLGYVLFNVDAREGVSAEAREMLRKEEPDLLLASEVRVSTAAKALPAAQRTAWDPGADPRGAEDYPRVLDEVMQRLGAKAGRRAG